MTKDLELTLDELGPDYRALVRRLNVARTADAPREWSLPSRTLPLLAASLLVAMGLCVVWLSYAVRQSEGLSVRTVGPTSAPHLYVLADLGTDEAVRELVRTQRADGSWCSDFLTRRNAAALKCQTSPEARIAYKKAVRNLRLRGRL